MAKNDNLKEFLTEIADTIRAKKGITGKINPQDFSSEISSIESGGGSVERTEAPFNDVNFIDFDGFILHSYTKDEFLALTEFPENPSRPGLTCQGWNWSLEDARTQVQEYGICDIGALYVTDDNSTRLYVEIASMQYRTITLILTTQNTTGAPIDWGDGKTDEYTYGALNLTHTYEEKGSYVITIANPNRVPITTPYDGVSSSSLFGSSIGNADKYRGFILQKAELGFLFQVIGGAFQNCTGLRKITVGISQRFSGMYTFRESRIECVVFPPLTAGYGTHCFRDCRSLTSVSLVPNAKSVPTYAFYNCYAMRRAVLPYTLTNLGSYAFYGCYQLKEIKIPAGVSQIQNYTFSNCYGLLTLDFRHHTAVPSLSSTNALNNVPSSCKIVVPDELFDSWKTSTNWSSFSSRIIKLSEYIAQ